MSRSPFDFAAPAFDASLEPATFFMGSPQEEALARLEWLIDKRLRLGLVVAESGCGKSHLAAMAARRLGGVGAEAVVLPLRGLAEGDWLPLLIDRLPLDPASRRESTRHWQKLDDHLGENALMERPTVLVFDDIEHAPADAIDGIVRLISSPDPRHARLLVVATIRPAGLAKLPDDLVGRSVVRIELPPWGSADTVAFLQAEIRRVDGREGVFSEDAAMTLARLSGGVPRTVCQIAGLSIAAAAGDGLDAVDAGTVERAWRELSAAGGAPVGSAPPDRAAAEPATEARPQVRAVRRLFG